MDGDGPVKAGSDTTAAAMPEALTHHPAKKRKVARSPLSLSLAVEAIRLLRKRRRTAINPSAIVPTLSVQPVLGRGLQQVARLPTVHSAGHSSLPSSCELGDSDSERDDAWHENYYAHADCYDDVKAAVRQAREKEVHDPFEPYAEVARAAPDLKLYHLFTHSSPAALDVKTRCLEVGLRYVPLAIEDEADLDHGKYEQYRSNFEQDLNHGLVAGLVADPPCETFLNMRFRSHEGPGRYAWHPFNRIPQDSRQARA